MRQAYRVALLAAVGVCLGAAEPKTTRVGGHTYAFPPAVFMGGEVETGPVGTVLIELAWPEMRGLTPAELAAWPRRDTIRVLANSGAPVAGAAVPEAELTAHIPLDVNIATALSSGIAETASGHVPTPRPAPPGDEPAEAVPGNGMTRVETEPALPDAIQHDVFVREPIGTPEEFIQCARGDKDVVAPECSQMFVVLNLIVKASYRRALVPQWREIHTRIAAYLTQHEVSR